MIVVNDPRVGRYVAQRIGYGNEAGASIGWERNGEIVAGVVYTDYNGKQITAAIAADAPLAREFVRVIFDYPFNQLKVERITATIEADNRKSHRLCKHFGFTHEAVLQRAGRRGDLHVYRLFREDCRWLGEPL